MAATKQACYQRFQRSNSRFRMEDSVVRLLRQCRTASPPPSARELAELFEVSERQVNRLIHGDVRREAGGPIEERAVDPDAERLRPSPFLKSIIVRCRGCGCRSHPSKYEPELCWSCHQKRARGQL